MGIAEDLNAEVNKIIREAWHMSEGRVVPESEDLALGNNGISLEIACIYADVAESTALVKSMKPEFAAEIYKCYLNCACRIIRHQGGAITAFDGDRVMGVFVGNSRNTAAVRASLAISHAVSKIINPALQDYYKEKLSGYVLKHGVGVDSGKTLVARAGIRGANDLVWVGKCANRAAKLSAIRSNDACIWISEAVYNAMDNTVKFSGSDNMWRERVWADQDNIRIYCTNYFWSL